MANLITVTVPGGSFNGDENDKEISINADNIIIIEEVNHEDDEIGNSIITMIDKSRYCVNETRDQLKKLTNK